MDPTIARQTWRRLETVHGMIYFTPDVAVEYAALGVADLRAGYFASRSAVFGEASAATIVATLFNFHPDVVARSIDGVWQVRSKR